MRGLMPLTAEETVEHDKYFLNLLEEALNWEVTEIKLHPNTEPCPDIRFGLINQTKTKYINIGASLFTTTSPFGLGKPVIDFFAFYNFKPSTEQSAFGREYLYSSELYIWTPTKLKSYRDSWWNRFAKLTSDWGKSCTTGVEFKAKPGENPPALEQALIACVMRLGKECCPIDFKKILKIDLHGQPTT